MIPALILFLLVLLAPPVLAQNTIGQDGTPQATREEPALVPTVQVTSGEHEGFTRVVLNFGGAVDWQFGRTEDGYEFRKMGAAVRYDLRAVFNLIGKSRLAAISADAAMLDIGFACACHAIPFEFRPGIIVIDLRDGPPPKGSSFEDPLPPRGDNAQPPVTGSGYNWADQVFRQIQSPTSATLSLSPKPTSDPALQPLRDQLLRQLSRGASDGVVDLALPKTLDPIAKKPVEGARISLGEMPGVAVQGEPNDKPVLGQTGLACASEARLDVDSWGTDAPIAEQFSEAFANMLGEFDRPDPEAVEKAVHFLLFIGFGQEAGQMVTAFMPDAPEANMLRSLAKIVDGYADEDGFFAGQVSCETPAALWALLAMKTVGTGDLVNDQAVVLAYSNLPVQLRRLLGPPLADKLLSIGKTGAAESVRNAVARAGKTAEVSLIEAKLDMSQGDPAAAQKNLEAAIQGAGGSKTVALIGLVDSLVAQGVPIKSTIADDLAAVARETKGTENAAGVTRALALALASSGQYAAAFEAATDAATVVPKIWDILARLGTDTDLLTFAVRPVADVPQDLELATPATLANRLNDLGLPDAAAEWIAAYPKIDAESRAKIALDRRDGRTALQAAQEVEGEQGARLQAAALQLLGDHLAAAQAFSKLGDAKSQELSYAKAGDWAELRNSPPNVWTPVLSTLDVSKPAASPLPGPLGQGQQLIANSAQTRAAVLDLLTKIPKVSTP